MANLASMIANEALVMLIEELESNGDAVTAMLDHLPPVPPSRSITDALLAAAGNTDDIDTAVLNPWAKAWGAPVGDRPVQQTCKIIEKVMSETARLTSHMTAVTEALVKIRDSDGAPLSCDGAAVKYPHDESVPLSPASTFTNARAAFAVAEAALLDPAQAKQQWLWSAECAAPNCLWCGRK